MGLDKLRYPSRTTESFDELPIGFYLPWEKAMQGALPEWFVECNGQLLDDPESSFHGNYIPNLNGVAKVKDVNFTSASASASMVTTKDIYAGASVTSASVPAGTVVLSIDSETNVTLSNTATASGIVSATIGGNGGVFLRGGATSGVWQADQMQRITGKIEFRRTGSSAQLATPLEPEGALQGSAGTGASLGTCYPTNAVTHNMDRLFFNSASSPNARTGTETWDETRPTNHSVVYVMKIKLLGKTKLITGYNINGDAFHQFQLGTPESADEMVYYDTSAASYKKSKAISPDGANEFTGANTFTGATPQVASAWVNINGTGVVEIRDDYNVDSITDDGTALYTINFETALATANYAIAGSVVGSIDAQQRAMITSAGSAITTAGFSIACPDVSNNMGDKACVHCIVFGGV